MVRKVTKAGQVFQESYGNTVFLNARKVNDRQWNMTFPYQYLASKGMEIIIFCSA